MIKDCHHFRRIQTNPCFAGSSLSNVCPLPSSPHPLRDLQELDACHLWVCREEGLCWTASVSGHCSRTTWRCCRCGCAPILTGQFCRIKCKIFKTKEDITIKISDQVGQSCYWSSLLPPYLWYFDNRTANPWLSQGGGISRNEKRKVFNYMYSTAPQVPSI